MKGLSSAYTICLILLFGILVIHDIRGTAPETRDIQEIRARITPGLTAEFAARDLTFGTPVFMRIFKEEAELEVWAKNSTGFAHFKTYDICNFSGALGPKLKEGDRQSPEGFYTVNMGALNPNSRFHLSFNLGFPNAFDRSRGRTGSFLMVHGACASIGCYAMTDAGIEEIYVIAEAALLAGQDAFSVHAFPFRMTDDRLAKEVTSPWYEFWGTLKSGYDAFEISRIPPEVRVFDNRYVIAARN